jgi:hypothetical protein
MLVSASLSARRNAGFAPDRDNRAIAATPSIMSAERGALRVLTSEIKLIPTRLRHAPRNVRTQTKSPAGSVF